MYFSFFVVGLDPPTVHSLSPLLYKLAARSAPRLIISLRPQDKIPDWITHVVVLGPSDTVALQGRKSEVFDQLGAWKSVVISKTKPQVSTRDSSPKQSSETEHLLYDIGEKVNLLHDMGMITHEHGTGSKKVITYGEPVVEMDGVHVHYGDKTVLGDWEQTVSGEKKKGLHWQLRRGQRWGVFGLNGSGKTTLISLITSDHPQTYGLPVRLFGRSRLPEPGKPGISIFDLQSRIGHSSPEIHSFFPRNISIRRSIETAWADTFLSKPRLNHDRNLDVDAALRFFEADLNPDFSTSSTHPSSLDWASSINFAMLTIAQQRLVLFLRSIIHKPDLVILDEAFAGMPRSLRDKCLHFLEVGELLDPSTGSRRVPDFSVWQLPSAAARTDSASNIRHRGLSENQALIVISHVKEEVPDTLTHWMRLPSPADGESKGMTLKMGTLGEEETVSDGWDEIWGVR